MMDFTDLTKRLRENADLDEMEGCTASVVALEREAADALSALQSELAAVRQELEEAKRDAERLDWVSAQLDEMGSVWFLPSGEELRFVQVRHCGHTANFPTVAGLRAAIDAARKQSS